MKIFPAIDIKDKKCVRLIKGNFETKTEYEISPIEQAGKYKDHGRFLSWVMRIAHNIIMDHYRKINRLPKYDSKHEDLDLLAQLIEKSNSIEELIIETQIHADLSILIDELPRTQREVLRMRLFQEMSFKDIGEQTGVSINTALGRMRYALLNLRKLIEERNLIFTQ